MDEKTLLSIIRRMDVMERRIMARIDSLEGFKNRIIGAAFFASALATYIVKNL